MTAKPDCGLDLQKNSFLDYLIVGCLNSYPMNWFDFYQITEGEFWLLTICHFVTVTCLRKRLYSICSDLKRNNSILLTKQKLFAIKGDINSEKVKHLYLQYIYIVSMMYRHLTLFNFLVIKKNPHLPPNITGSSS